MARGYRHSKNRETGMLKTAVPIFALPETSGGMVAF
jgi:hypothetical protein